jgi:hypothetical protein
MMSSNELSGPANEQRQDLLELKDLALKCIVCMVHMIHGSSPDQVSVMDIKVMHGSGSDQASVLNTRVIHRL